MNQFSILDIYNKIQWYRNIVESTIINIPTPHIKLEPLTGSLCDHRKQYSITKLLIYSLIQINHLRNLNNININGDDVPDPLENFQHLRTQKTWTNLAIPDTLINNLLSYGFNEPTPVQMQSVPAMLNVTFSFSLNQNFLL